MKKRMICMALVMAAALTVSSSVVAQSVKLDQDGYAVLNSSRQADPRPDVQGDEVKTGPVVIEKLPEATGNLVSDINAGKKSIQDIPGINTNGKVAVTEIFELYWASDPNKQSPATVTLTNVELPGNAAGVKILHYSTVRQTWEVIDPISVNLAARTVTAYFPDMGPVVIVADAGATSPNTGAGF